MSPRSPRRRRPTVRAESLYVVGLTGGIGSGKSTIGRMLAERGATVLEADQLAREVVEPGTEGFREVVERFGEEVVTSQGGLDRQRVATIVFDDEEARQDLNAIIHPRVHARIEARLADLEGSSELGADGIVVVDVPLLVEAEGDRPYQSVVVVLAPEEVRIERLVRERDMDRDEVRNRMRAQASDEERLAVATHVVDNSGDLEDLERRVDALYEALSREARRAGAHH
ncbi:MAG: dephospho-CoA kinase [Nitriliruptorales bacterium]